MSNFPFGKSGERLHPLCDPIQRYHGGAMLEAEEKEEAEEGKRQEEGD